MKLFGDSDFTILGAGLRYESKDIVASPKNGSATRVRKLYVHSKRIACCILVHQGAILFRSFDLIVT